ncbi:hypothetical protein TNCV_4213041 [Trichonephila clavipes]|nr:hypothetical protein TNCV_4213041 [Trichonephila clavipes]
MKECRSEIDLRANRRATFTYPSCCHTKDRGLGVATMQTSCRRTNHKSLDKTDTPSLPHAVSLPSIICRFLSDAQRLVNSGAYHKEIGITQECGCVGFNGPDGRQGCVLTRTVESNQGGRFDSNESVADSFPSGAVGFKSWSARILGAFSLLHLPEKTSSRESNSLAEVTLRRSYSLR